MVCTLWKTPGYFLNGLHRCMRYRFNYYVSKRFVFGERHKVGIWEQIVTYQKKWEKGYLRTDTTAWVLIINFTIWQNDISRKSIQIHSLFFFSDNGSGSGEGGKIQVPLKWYLYYRTFSLFQKQSLHPWPSPLTLLSSLILGTLCFMQWIFTNFAVRQRGNVVALVKLRLHQRTFSSDSCT